MGQVLENTAAIGRRKQLWLKQMMTKQKGCSRLMTEGEKEE
jgi:hypothetical protein